MVKQFNLLTNSMTSDIRDPNIRNPDTQIHPDINNDIDNSSKDMQTNEDEAAYDVLNKMSEKGMYIYICICI
jgi:hypothetical protein